jgi:neutral/alkaline ceramidase-like enzyme
VHTCRRFRAVCLIGWVLCVASPLAARAETQVGVAEADITPPTGFPMAGYYYERLAAGTHDPLKAKAIVFVGDNDQAAIVVCDLTGISTDLTAEVRRRAAQKTGIPAANIVVSGTHSHTAPDYGKDLYEYLGGKAEANKPRYSETLINRIVEAIDKAKQAVGPISLFAGSATQTTPISFNRRFLMRDGSIRTWANFKNPDVVRAAGPIDPEVGLLLVRSAKDQKPLGLFSNFALHLDTVGGLYWSGDYPYYVEQDLRKSLGGDLVSIFGNGTCGDINHNDPNRSTRNKTDFIGHSLAATIESGLSTLHPLDKPVLRVERTTVRLPLPEISAADVKHSEQLLQAAKAGQQVEFFEHVTAYKTVMLDGLRNRPSYSHPENYLKWGLSHSLAGVGDFIPVDVHAICLGKDVAIVCLPGEVFVDLGLAIKRGSPFRTTLIVELSDAVETMYVPTRAAYVGGGYEVTNSAVQPGSGEMLVESALRLLRTAASGAMKH